jgi:hypothetical protein
MYTDYHAELYFLVGPHFGKDSSHEGANASFPVSSTEMETQVGDSVSTHEPVSASNLTIPNSPAH